jgi:hypothetical protein
MPDVARKEVLTERAGKGATCSESSLSVTVWDPRSPRPLYRVTGCGTDKIVSCHIGRGGSTLCDLTPLCTTDGCDSFELAVRNEFVESFSCPLERVSTEPHADVAHPAPTPPDDVASDPERLRIWKRNNSAPRRGTGLTFFTASGCGHQQVYGCRPSHEWLTSSGGAIKGSAPDCRWDMFFPKETR